MRYDAYLFDLDGTLLDTLDDLTAAVNHVMTSFGLATHTRDEVRGFVGNGIRNLMERSIPQGQSNPCFEDAFHLFETYYTAHCNEQTRPFDGMPELLRNLRDAGCQLAIISNKNDAAVKELAHHYFADTVSTAIGVSAAVRRKPAPDTVLSAMREFGCTAKRALYIGDSDVDKITADNAAIDCALVTWGYRDRELLESMKARYLVDTPMQLLEQTREE